MSSSQQSLPLYSSRKESVAGGNLRRGMDRLVRVLERRVDRQVMVAQIRAYDNTAQDITTSGRL
jgi:hypothetical protein